MLFFQFIFHTKFYIYRRVFGSSSTSLIQLCVSFLLMLAVIASGDVEVEVRTRQWNYSTWWDDNTWEDNTWTPQPAYRGYSAIERAGAKRSSKALDVIVDKWHCYSALEAGILPDTKHPLMGSFLRVRAGTG